MIKLLSPKDKAVISLHTLSQQIFIDGAYTACPAKEEDSIPSPVIIEFEPRADGLIVLTRSRDGKETAYPARNGRAEIFNLTVGDEYLWQVKIGLMTSEARSFSTVCQAPRLMRIDGISNVRDIGGYVTTDQKHLRQDLLFRSSELDCHFEITDKGRDQLIHELGIRTDVDLRGINGESANAVLTGVNHLCFPTAAYSDIFSDGQRDIYKQIFTLLSKRDIYPALIHCWSGADRTGTLCYVLGALLGIDEGELEADFEMSSFSVCGSRSADSEAFKKFKAEFYSFDSVARAAAEKFLLSCGVDEDTIRDIRSIFTI